MIKLIKVFGKVYVDFIVLFEGDGDEDLFGFFVRYYFGF